MNTPTNIPLPEPMRTGVAKLERNGFRVVRVAPNGPDPESGFTAYLSKRTRTGLLLAQVELDRNGGVTTHR
ncbi:MAG: hypothetical protein J0M04_05640 [Verrucomicrobia bacterium]|nr:hypothetical protein [Verrucomicrobiota bacterium]